MHTTVEVKKTVAKENKMKMFEQVRSDRIYMGRLDFGCDLLEALTRVCMEQNIILGRLEAIGAVQSAHIGFYDQKSREYRIDVLDRPMEITQLTGNISLKDGKSFIHAHISLVDREGKAHGGHLSPGTIIFACEFVIESFDGPKFDRIFDPETGLPLWTKG